MTEKGDEVMTSTMSFILVLGGIALLFMIALMFVWIAMCCLSGFVKGVQVFLGEKPAVLVEELKLEEATEQAQI